MGGNKPGTSGMGGEEHTCFSLMEGVSQHFEFCIQKVLALFGKRQQEVRADSVSFFNTNTHTDLTDC